MAMHIMEPWKGKRSPACLYAMSLLLFCRRSQTHLPIEFLTSSRIRTWWVVSREGDIFSRPLCSQLTLHLYLIHNLLNVRGVLGEFLRFLALGRVLDRAF